MPRVPIDASHAPSGKVIVSGADARHLAKVLRLELGDAVTAFDGAGHEWDAVIAIISPSRVELTLCGARMPRPESPCAILLGQGVAKGEKLELVLRAATELGVAGFVPVLTSRSVAAAEGKGRVDRWRRIAAEACKQCGRATVPNVLPPESLAEFLVRAAECDLKVVPWEGGGIMLPQAIRGTVPGTTAGTGAILIGPEGGLSSREVDLAQRAGFVPVSLGPRVLRTETAGIVAVAAMQLVLGDLA